MSQVRSGVRKRVNKAVARVRAAGGRVAHVVAETPEFVSLHRTDRAIRGEMAEHYETIGKRAFALHKRARGESPFAHFETILGELETLERLEDEYRENRVRLGVLKDEIRHPKK